jgi:glycosyltransferase involved in cell wall biosynthesis
MRIVIDAANIDTGGAFKQLVAFARRARESHHDVDMLCARPAPYRDELRDSGVQVIQPELLRRAEEWGRRRGPVGGAMRLLLTWRWRENQLPEYLAEVRADVLFNPNALLPARRPARCAAVVMSQNMLPFDARARRLLPAVPDRLRLKLVRRGQVRGFCGADGVVFISEHAAREIPRQVSGLPARISVNPLGVDDRVFHPAPALEVRERRRIVYVSFLQPYKHHGEVIRALGELRPTEVGEYELLLVGSDWRGAQTRLEQLAVSVGVRERVKFLGLRSEAEVAQVLREADVGLFASSCENCPTTLIEKMKSGLPIAASRLAPMTDILGDAGVYFDPTRPGEIAQALRGLLLDPAQCARLARAAARRAEVFRPTTHNDTLLAFMQECVAVKRADLESE